MKIAFMPIAGITYLQQLVTRVCRKFHTLADLTLFAAKLRHGILQRCQEAQHEVLFKRKLTVTGLSLSPASIGERSDDLGEAGDDDRQQHDSQSND